jgi:hypothetical protein
MPITSLDEKNIKLSSNDLEGYDFEIKTQDHLIKNGLTFMGNPRDKGLWKQNIKKGCDIYIPDLDMEIECKSATKRVWPSSIDFNYIPRFKEESTLKVVVTNNLRMFGPECRQRLKDKSIGLVDLEHLPLLIYKFLKSLCPVVDRLILSVGLNTSSGVVHAPEDQDNLDKLGSFHNILREGRLLHESLGLVFYPLAASYDANIVGKFKTRVSS